MTGVVDPAFRVIPKNATCFYIWRIEKMQVVPVSREQCGKFFTGDSYIIFSATEYGQPAGVHIKQKEAKGSLEMHIHFWLGSETSQDEAGVAAYKTVELDDYLGGSPVQHREVEGRESKRFLSYFKDGIRLITGGVASGFSTVTDEFEPKLYHLKGKRTPVVRQLLEISWSVMNDGDVFILDARDAIFVWIGKNANNIEKIHGAKVAQTLKGEHGGSTIIFVEDEKEAALPEAEKQFFEKFLNIKQKKVKLSSEVESDSTQDRRIIRELKLYRCSDEGGTLKVTEVKGGPLYQADLIPDDSYIIDNSEQGIWVWVGKKASHKERVEAMRNAQGFIKKKGYPNFTAVTRVIDGGEPLEFKTLFRGWRDKNQTVGLGRKVSAGKIAKTVQTKFDAATLHENQQLAAETQMVDDGSGQKEVWRVDNFNLVPVPPKHHGKFFGGDCYVILYAYTTGTSDHYIIYYWLGMKSSLDEQGTAALKAVELDDKLGGRPVQVRVVQGKEPPHFMAMFGGKMTVFSGGKASSFDGNNANDEGPGDTYLLQVRGTTQYNTKAVQVELRAASLNSNDVFALMSPSANFVWCGKGSTGDEREMAKKLASRGPAEPVTVYEGQEKQDFWEAIGGKEIYSSEKRPTVLSESYPSRLFHCSNASGIFRVEEIIDFNQCDLIQEDVMLLDAWNTIFLWIGKGSNKEEQKLSGWIAQEYLKTDPAGRDINTPIIKIKQGFEPPNFTGFFGVWDRSLWNNNKTFEEIKKEIKDMNPGLSVLLPQTNGGEMGFNDYVKFPMEVLQIRDPDELPAMVDPAHKELHLTEDDFRIIFNMDHKDFESLPRWKQQQIKKTVDLF